MPAIFDYVTFGSTVSFRNSDFSNGLDIQNTNFKEHPNFLRSKIEFIGSNRETFRSIKNAFDKVGNHIEANKYFALELKKYKDELYDEKNKDATRREKFVFYLNEKVSDFGQDYWKPIKLLILSVLIYSFLIIGHERNWLYQMYPEVNGIFSIISSLVNSIAKGFIPFHKILRDGMEFISLIFGLILSGLIWQTVVAIKRHTRR